MGIYKSDNARTSFEFQYEDYSNANGSMSFEFSCDVKSFDFTAKLNSIWFYDDDLATFSKELAKLTTNELEVIRLVAMSDFELTIKKEDDLGHFEVTIKLDNPVQRNSAILTTSLSTQSLLDFANEIKRIIQNQ